MKSKAKRIRDIPIYVRVTQAEYNLIQDRMIEANTTNMAAYVRKMILNGYVLHVDLSPVKELVSLQRRCSNNLNQIATNVNAYNGITPQEISTLQNDYKSLWTPLSDLLKHLAGLIKM